MEHKRGKKKLFIVALATTLIFGFATTSFASSGTYNTIYEGRTVNTSYAFTSTQIDGGILAPGANSCSVQLTKLDYTFDGISYTRTNLSKGTGTTAASIRLIASSREQYLSGNYDYRVNNTTVYGKIGVRP